MEKIYDVIIVGAGFSGLASGKKLFEHNKNFLIIEANDTIAGRVNNYLTQDGTLLELGGQWIGSDHTEMRELVKKYHLKLYNSPPLRRGQYLYEYNKQIISVPNESLPQTVIDALKKIDDLAKTIDVYAPHKHPEAKLWDNITFEKWLKLQNYSPEVSNYLNRTISEACLSTSSSSTSLLTTLFYIASNGGFSKLSNYENGAQEKRVVGGVELIANAIRDEIGYDKFKMKEPVIKVDYKKTIINVHTNKSIYQTKHVIFALAPSLLKNIVFKPQLPRNYKNLFKNFLPGEVLKVHFIYNEPFWRKQNLTGVCLKTSQYFTEITDNSVPHNRKGILTGFIYGKQKLQILQLPLNERVKKLNDELIMMFGHQALNFLKYIEFDWSAIKWHVGCFVSRLDLGGWTKWGKSWRCHLKKLYFGGTEQSALFNGYFEGAVRVGYELVDHLIKET